MGWGALLPRTVSNTLPGLEPALLGAVPGLPSVPVALFQATRPVPGVWKAVALPRLLPLP